MRLGILTGGGDCPGLNAVIRAVVVRTVRTHDGLVLGFSDGWRGLILNRVRELNLQSVAGALPRGGTLLGTSRVDPFREAGGVEAIRDAIAAHELQALIVCGGDGTLSAAAKLAEAGAPIIGIPKTIDNDVHGTDYSLGFDTALSTLVHAIDALHTHAESHDRVIVIEVMGRNAGWLALAASVAGGGDVVVAPELPMSLDDVCRCIRSRSARGRDFSIVVVAEGAAFLPEPDATTFEAPFRHDAVGRKLYGGVGDLVAREIEQRLGVETRTVNLGYVQRGGTPSAFDRLLGTQMGLHAVDLAVRGQMNRMVCSRAGRVTSVELSVVLQGTRMADPELVEAARVFFG
jgi:6-phosphofructokinase 1